MSYSKLNRIKAKVIAVEVHFKTLVKKIHSDSESDEMKIYKATK